MEHTTKKEINIEDIMIDKRSTDYDTIRMNMTVYKTMIHEIFDWMNEIQSNQGKQKVNIRSKFISFYSKMSNRHRVYVKKSILVLVYRHMIENDEIEDNPVMWSLIQKRPARNLSGVTVVTVLTSPYPDGQEFSCKHNCYYCPNEPDMPRSYLKDEPAVARGFPTSGTNRADAG